MNRMSGQAVPSFFNMLCRTAAPIYLALVHEATAFHEVKDVVPGGRGPLREIWVAERALHPVVGRQVQERHIRRLLLRKRVSLSSVDLLREYELFALRPETVIWPTVGDWCAQCRKKGTSCRCLSCNRTSYCNEECRNEYVVVCRRMAYTDSFYKGTILVIIEMCAPSFNLWMYAWHMFPFMTSKQCKDGTPT